MEIRPEPIDSAVAQRLIGELNAELSAAYHPAQRFHELPIEDVDPGRGRFVVAWLNDAPVGCGAVRMRGDETAELKRMYAAPAVRGRGVSTAILAALEREAASLGAGRIVLETGDKQLAALGL